MKIIFPIKISLKRTVQTFNYFALGSVIDSVFMALYLLLDL